MNEYKVYVKDKETNRKVQEHAFSLGYKWYCGNTDIDDLNILFLFFNKGYDITFVDTFEDFIDHSATELTPEEFLRLTPEDVKPKEKEKLYLYMDKESLIGIFQHSCSSNNLVKAKVDKDGNIYIEVEKDV